ncbi:MAG: exodeoxyribonuclease I [Wenzhouxiangellaceae bacterium]|nr:exodeoxyribonuclease I [Wenzhouxiangellaceae bacterium]
MANAETFLWHDYETFGADPRRDRPCQFAAIRTDVRLEPVGEPVVWYCQPTSDVLPTPEACLITGITPQLALERGVPEYEFANRVFDLMSTPGTCSVGYNNFRFDDEVSRFLFWRNFIDPYAREFKNGNSRFDLIDVLRLTRALRPDGIAWHDNDDGWPGFRLEDLARANGFPTDRAHDALADVENTIAMARLVASAQPKLWQWALSLRDRRQAERLLSSGNSLLHASSRFPAVEFCIAPVVPLFRHPDIRTQWLVWNLRHSPEPFFDHDAEMLADLYWTPQRDLPEDLVRLPVKWIRTNRCPMLSPMNVLDGAARRRTAIDPQQSAAHAALLAGAPEFVARLGRAFGEARRGVSQDPETALYDGFVPNGDRALAERVRRMSPDEIAALLDGGAGPFADDRLNDLMVHFIGRHAEERLDPEHQTEWHEYRARKLCRDPELASIRIDEYRERVAALAAQHPERADVLEALAAWPDRLGL